MVHTHIPQTHRTAHIHIHAYLYLYTDMLYISHRSHFVSRHIAARRGSCGLHPRRVASSIHPRAQCRSHIGMQFLFQASPQPWCGLKFVQNNIVKTRVDQNDDSAVFGTALVFLCGASFWWSLERHSLNAPPWSTSALNVIPTCDLHCTPALPNKGDLGAGGTSIRRFLNKMIDFRKG